MKSRRFCPVAVDALEDRLVLTAFVVPFSLVTPPASEVNPKFLNLTGRTESQISGAISNAFNRFGSDYIGALNAYNKGLAKPGADSTALLNTFDNQATRAFNRLSDALANVSHKLPFGGVNLNPVLQNRAVGSTGVTDTTTKVNTPSLQTRLSTLQDQGSDVSVVKSTIGATQNLVRTDVKNYINLGVTNGYFKLTRGAFLPALS